MDYPNYKLVSESNHLLLLLNCTEGCEPELVNSVDYSYKIFKSLDESLNFNWIPLTPKELKNASGIN